MISPHLQRDSTEQTITASMPPIPQTDANSESFVDSMFAPTRLFAPLMVAIVTWVVGMYVALILESPYWNDDIIDKNIPSILKTTHTPLGAYIGAQISAFVRQDARFDPGLLAWTYSLFDVFDNRGAYKLVIGLLLVLALSAAALCVAAMAKNWVPAGAFILIVSGILQVRYWADGITSFAGVMMLTTALTFGALLLLLVKRGVGWTVLASALYMVALLTYEDVFLFAPVLIVIIILLRRDWRPAIAIAVPAAVALLIAVSLRLFTNPHPVPEYTLSFVPSAVLLTFAKQMVAALPLSQWWIGHTLGLAPIAGTLILMSAVFVGIPVFIGLRRLSEDMQLPNERAAKLFGLLGIWMWITPAILVAVTKRWQTEMPLGQGYIPVVYEYFGLALCLLSLWLFVGDRLRTSRRTHIVRAWHIGGSTAFALLSTLTMAANLSLLS
jgi:hypothetical protein